MAEDKKKKQSVIEYETEIIVNGVDCPITIDVDLETIDVDVFKKYLESENYKVLDEDNYKEMEECFDLCKPLMDLFKKECYSKVNKESFIEYFTKWKV